MLTNLDSIAYALGYAPPVEAGPSPFAAGPAVGLVGADGTAGLEPGTYHPEIGGVRLEWMLQVTSAGCEPVCPFPHVPATE